MRGLRFLLLLATVAAGCADETTPNAPVTARTAPALDTVTRAAAGPPPAPAAPSAAPFDAPFDAPTTVFDTVESPPARRLEPPPPPPAPAGPEPPPDAATVWGRCDVRETEGFCFSYVGAGWTAAEAERHCRRVPSGTFGPSACADAERVATCAFERPDANGQTLVYTYYAPYAVDLARLACPGEFSAD